MDNPVKGQKADLFCVALIALAVAAVYGHTLGVPWYLDDIPGIVENPLLHDLGACLRQLFSPRGFTTLTFALNYRLGQLDPAGYHLVNIAIHLAASALVYLLFKRVWRDSSRLPLLGALLFAIHPLQTQAVTYVVQRTTSLAGLCLFLSLYLYVRARERLNQGGQFGEAGHLFYYLGALLTSGLALLSKENAAVLPLLLGMFDCYFLAGERRWRPRLFYLAPFLLAPLVYALVQILLPLAGGGSLHRLTGLYGPAPASSLYYLVTEFSVLWIYIRMFFLPFGQALLHDHPLVEGLLNWQSAMAGIALAGLAGMAWRWRKARPQLSFGIFWFFAALAIESTVFPLDPLFEHRLYVPLFGLVLALSGLTSLLPFPKAPVVVLGALCLVFAPLTWSRNSLWTDQVAFYQDNLRKVPHSAQVAQALAQSQSDQGRPQEAEAVLLQSLRLQPNLHGYVNLVAIYEEQGRWEEGFRLAQQGLQEFPESVRLNEALGLITFRLGNSELALHYLQRAVTIDPKYAAGYAGLGRVLFRLGRLTEADANFLRALDFDDGVPAVHSDYAVVLHSQKRLSQARVELQKALQLDPNHVPSLFRLGLLAAESGEVRVAREMLRRLNELNAPEAGTLAAEIR